MKVVTENFKKALKHFDKKSKGNFDTVTFNNILFKLKENTLSIFSFDDFYTCEKFEMSVQEVEKEYIFLLHKDKIKKIYYTIKKFYNCYRN